MVCWDRPPYEWAGPLVTRHASIAYMQEKRLEFAALGTNADGPTSIFPKYDRQRLAWANVYSLHSARPS